MTKNTPRIFISLLLMLLCIGILPVSARSPPDTAWRSLSESRASRAEPRMIGTSSPGKP